MALKQMHRYSILLVQEITLFICQKKFLKFGNALDCQECISYVTQNYIKMLHIAMHIKSVLTDR